LTYDIVVYLITYNIVRVFFGIEVYLYHVHTTDLNFCKYLVKVELVCLHALIDGTNLNWWVIYEKMYGHSLLETKMLVLNISITNGMLT
jgi:hypothetical protein